MLTFMVGPLRQQELQILRIIVNFISWTFTTHNNKVSSQILSPPPTTEIFILNILTIGYLYHLPQYAKKIVMRYIFDRYKSWLF